MKEQWRITVWRPKINGGADERRVTVSEWPLVEEALAAFGGSTPTTKIMIEKVWVVDSATDKGYDYLFRNTAPLTPGN